MTENKDVHDLASIIGGLSRLATNIHSGSSDLSEYSFYVVEAINQVSENMLSMIEKEWAKEKTKAEFNQAEVDTLAVELAQIRQSIPSKFIGAGGLYDIANLAIESRNSFHLRAAIAGIEAVLKKEAVA